MDRCAGSIRPDDGGAQPGHFALGRAAGFAPTRRLLQVPDEGQVQAVRVVLERASVCRGAVRAADGSTVAGVRLRADTPLAVHRPVLDQAPSWVVPSAIGAADGSFELVGVTTGWVRLHALDTPSGRWAARVDEVDVSAFRWEPVLGRGLSLDGRVRSAEGRPLEGWRVAVEGIAAERRVARTDGRGEFAIDGLENRRYTVLVLPPAPSKALVPVPTPGQIEQVAAALVLPEVHAAETLDLRVPAAAMPRWSVRAWIEGATERTRLASLTRIDGARYHAPIGKDGWVEVGPVPAGSYYLSLEHDNGMDLLRGPFSVGGSTGDVDLGALAVEALGRVRVRLRTQGPVPPDMVQVSISSPDAALVATVLALTGGEGVSWTVPPGDYLVSLEDPRLENAQQLVRVEPGVVAEVELVEQSCEPVEFHWDHPVFAGMRRVRLEVEDDGGRVRHYGFGIRSTADGPLRVRLLLPAGRYRVRGFSAFASASAEFEVVAHTPTTAVVLRR